jgi:hypothetical protein
MSGRLCGVLQLPIHHDFCVGTSIAKLEGSCGWKGLQGAGDFGSMSERRAAGSTAGYKGYPLTTSRADGEAFSLSRRLSLQLFPDPHRWQHREVLDGLLNAWT